MSHLPDSTEDLLVIIARAPVAGGTKTRLGATIGMDRAARLHRAFIADLAATFAPEACSFDVVWSFTPASFDFDGFLQDARPESAPLRASIPQPDGTFADKLTGLFQIASDRGYSRTMIMASDSPHLTVRTIAGGFDLLRTEDVVLGRVEDGGYYVVGMQGVYPVLDESVMSTGDAASDLVRTAIAHGLRVGELPASFDVDLEGDLTALVSILSVDPGLAPRTWATLIELRLVETPPHLAETAFIHVRD